MRRIRKFMFYDSERLNILLIFLIQFIFLFGSSFLLPITTFYLFCCLDLTVVGILLESLIYLLCERILKENAYN